MERFFSLLIKTKDVQNVTGCQKDSRKTEIQTDRQTGRLTERQIQDRKTFQLIKIKVVENVNRMSEK